MKSEQALQLIHCGHCKVFHADIAAQDLADLEQWAAATDAEGSPCE